MKWALSEPNPNSNSHTSYTDQKELKYLLKLWAIQVKNNQTPIFLSQTSNFEQKTGIYKFLPTQEKIITWQNLNPMGQHKP